MPLYADLGGLGRPPYMQTPQSWADPPGCRSPGCRPLQGWADPLGLGRYPGVGQTPGDLADPPGVGQIPWMQIPWMQTPPGLGRLI